MMHLSYHKKNSHASNPVSPVGKTVDNGHFPVYGKKFLNQSMILFSAPSPFEDEA